MPESDPAVELCLYCNLHPADPAAKPVEKTKTQRQRRCMQCKENWERIEEAAGRWALINAGIAVGISALAGLIAALIWGWGEYLVGFFVLGLFGGLIALGVSFFVVFNQAWEETPYKMRGSVEVQAELDEKLTLAELMAVALPDKKFEVVAAGRWQNIGTRIGSMVASAVFGMLASTEYRAGLIGISGSQLHMVDFGMVVGEKLTVAKLDAVEGTLQTESADLAKLTGTIETNETDIFLSLDGDLSYYIVFPKSFDANNEASAQKIHAALGKAA